MTTDFAAPHQPGPGALEERRRSRVDADRRPGTALSAGLAGLPQVSLPAGTVDGALVGLSLIGPLGGDGALLAMAEALTGA